MSSLMTKIVDNIQVKINQVHIRYEDKRNNEVCGIFFERYKSGFWPCLLGDCLYYGMHRFTGVIPLKGAIIFSS